MSFADRYTSVFKALLPAPFTIAVLLTLLTMLLALVFTLPVDSSVGAYSLEILSFWESGIWNGGLMVFAMQMMLILVLGHALALTPLATLLIEKATQYCNTTANAAAIVSFFTLIVALLNWGLGLIFGAIFARKVADSCKAKGLLLNYPIVGAAGYSGLMIWHGGLSGSAPLKVAENGSLTSMMKGFYTDEQLQTLPDSLLGSETIFSTMNIVLSLVLLVVLPLAMYWLGKRSEALPIQVSDTVNGVDNEEPPNGAEKLDTSLVLAYILGGLMLFWLIYKAFIKPDEITLSFLTLNYINLFLFGLGVVLHSNFRNYLKAIDEAIGGAAGILIQFPLYFGIMGIMTSSGLVGRFSDFFVSISNEVTFPVFTFISAGIVNVFVPSGGGQWAVQGPIIIQAAQDLGVSLPKSVMALAYGDQLTNMLQPFWALPLLGITGLKAKEILPYTLFLMLIGAVIYITGLLVF